MTRLLEEAGRRVGEELNENLKEVVQMLLEDGEPAISTEFIGIYTVQVA